MKKVIFLILPFLGGCAALHHVQLGNLDNRAKVNLRPIELKVSEVGVDLNDVKLIAKIAVGKEESKNFRELTEIIQLFQMGPHTGAGVYSLEFLKTVQDTLRSQCNNGYITGIYSIRETRKYPVISGEIIKVKAYCATVKGT